MECGIQLSSIGHVNADEEGFSLQLYKQFIPALNGLNGFGYLNIFWWANLFDDEEARSVLTCEKPYRKSPDTLGIFATRSPVRPNPICLSVVSVSHIDYDSGKIFIPYIDAEDGTPLVDIKPYHPAADRVKEPLVPDWCRHWPQWLEDSASFDWEAEFVNAR
jgi:tRNA-Thr(GGU) m(6)t(6)A37 methyltransferase TsaA